MPTAILIDGAYFLRRFSSTFPDLDARSPDDVALAVSSLATYHVAFRLGAKPMLSAIEAGDFLPEESPHLYRIFFYDCPPLAKKVHRPVSKLALDLSRTPQAQLRNAIHARLRGVRKVALRLGRLNDTFDWRLTPDALKRLAQAPEGFRPSDDDFELNVVQKGVDMRLGLDTASLAFKRQVDQIIIVAADADFVPAVKLARREGIDVVVDPMWGTPARDLLEHCDGVRNALLSGSPPHRQKA
jgi:uncharacterized LabA/DUF88 family protein